MIVLLSSSFRTTLSGTSGAVVSGSLSNDVSTFTSIVSDLSDSFPNSSSTLTTKS